MNAEQQRVQRKRDAERREYYACTLDPLAWYDVSEDRGQTWRKMELRGSCADVFRMGGVLCIKL